jgi:hypothetical protein
MSGRSRNQIYVQALLVQTLDTFISNNTSAFAAFRDAKGIEVIIDRLLAELKELIKESSSSGGVGYTEAIRVDGDVNDNKQDDISARPKKKGKANANRIALPDAEKAIESKSSRRSSRLNKDQNLEVTPIISEVSGADGGSSSSSVNLSNSSLPQIDTKDKYIASEKVSVDVKILLQSLLAIPTAIFQDGRLDTTDSRHVRYLFISQMLL